MDSVGINDLPLMLWLAPEVSSHFKNKVHEKDPVFAKEALPFQDSLMRNLFIYFSAKLSFLKALT